MGDNDAKVSSQPVLAAPEVVAAGNARAMRVDPYLEKLVDSADQAGLEIGMTLHVGGSIVTGTLISGASFFKLLAESIRRATGKDQDAINALAKDADTWGDRQYDKSSPIRVPPDHIHLRNAVLHYGGGTLTDVLWRGRLQAIDGFVMGVSV
jgi:hypothetical protein